MARDAPVIPVKLRAPRLRHDVVRRPRVWARLDARDGDSARIVLVSAPAGSGKTVLVLEWIEASDVPHVWLSLDAHDNDPVRFRRHLAAALEGADCEACAAAGRLLRSLPEFETADPDAELLHAFESIPPDRVIVLDDLHALDSTDSLGLLYAVVTRTTGGPRWALLTRMDPPLPLARLRVAGELIEVREDDLRFTLDEARALFGTLLRRELEPGVVEVLERKTEGWAAGLRLAAIALERAEDPTAAAAGFAGTHRVVVDYLLDEALANQEPEVQWFLSALSILPRFTADTCAAVLGDERAPELLQQVEARNLFLVALGGGWYRFHHLFAELLEFRLARVNAEAAETLRSRAAAWFAAHGDVQEALRQASLMRDRRALLDLLDVHGMDLCALSELASFGRWSDLVPSPETLDTHPGFLAALLWYRMLSERAPDLSALEVAARRALDAASARPELSAADERRLAEIRLQLDIREAYRLRFAGTLDEAVDASVRALQRLPAGADFAAGLVLHNLGAARLALADEGARDVLERSVRTNTQGGPPYLLLSSLGLLANAIAQEEGVAAARARLDAAHPVVTNLRLQRLPAAAMPLAQRGWLAWLHDELDLAASHLHAALRLAQSGAITEAAVNALVLLARVEVGRGRGTQADEYMGRALALSRTCTVTLVGTTLSVEAARLDLLRGRGGRSPHGAAVLADAEAWTAAHEAAALLELLRWLRDGDGTDGGNGSGAPIHALAGRVLAEATQRRRGVAELLARLASAMAERDRQRRWRAMDDLLCLAGQRGYRRPLLEGGPRVHRLIAGALGQPLSPPAREAARDLITRFDDDMSIEPVGAAPGIVVQLTDRERAVLDCLARSMSNKAIARTMFVSTDTVKTHLRHIYDKLGVADRGTAVERAHELGILTVDA